MRSPEKKDFGANPDNILDIIKGLAASLGLNEEEIKLFDSVMRLYGSKTQNQLILVTHSEQPWSEAREGLLPYESSNKPISLETMYTYYKERRERRMSRQ